MSQVLLASSSEDGRGDTSTRVLKTSLGNTRRPLRALVENYARSSAFVYERAQSSEGGEKSFLSGRIAGGIKGG